ncbi:HEPN domain-containing protein [Bacteroidota bacterium]
MTEIIEHKGIWWLPDNHSEQIHGILKYDPEEGVKLDLIGAFPRQVDKFELILGFTENGKSVTLYNSFEIQRGFNLPGMDTQKIYSNFAIVGSEHIDNLKNLKFYKSVIFLKHLDEWVNKREGFKIDQNLKEREVTIKYRLPEGIETKVGNKFKLTINPTAKGPSLNIVQKEAKITQRINCIFSYSRKKSFNDILEDISHFEQFLTLCSQRPTHPIEFYLLNKDEKGKFTKRFDIYHQITIDKTAKKDLTPFDFLVQFKPIEAKFEALINKWFSSHTNLETCYIPFFNNYFGKHLYTSDKFLNMCRALEAFHRDTIGVNDPTTGREYHYKKRIIEVFDSVRSCFNFLLKIRDKNRFADKIKNYRNDFTHSNPILLDRNKKYLETHYLTEKLTIIMSCALLHYQGLTKKEIKQRMTDTSLYSHIKYKMK